MAPAPANPEAGARPDPWTELRRHTPARLALGRAGDSLPTAELLNFGAAHALARDAVHVPLDGAALQADLAPLGWPTMAVSSQAMDRRNYLRRPDLGRRLAPGSLQPLADAAGRQAQTQTQSPQLVIVLGDGLSATAVQRHAPAVLAELQRLWRQAPGDAPTLAPLVIAQQARVALADEVGECLGAALALMLLGERPGLSSPDSLGAYLTFAPRVGAVDAARNCVSNIRPEGLPPAQAAARLAWLIREALRRRLTGIGLKDDSAVALLGDDGCQAANQLRRDRPGPSDGP